MTNKSAQHKPRIREKLEKIFRRNKKDSCPTQEVFTFEQNLQAFHFVNAGRQLITREDRLFELRRDGIGSKKLLLEDEDDSAAKLAKDYEDLLESVKWTLENTLNLQSTEEQEILKEAVQTILREEEQDARWEGFQEKERPPWRPRCCKQNHEVQLERLVQTRMEETQVDSSVEPHSSLEHLIFSKVTQLKEDLLHVVTWVDGCYPEEENICQVYASFYHQNFSARLKDAAQGTVCDEDCVLLLKCVQDYNNFLNDKRLKDAIERTLLDPLLPEEMIKPLEHQFLTFMEKEVQTWLQKILSREEMVWKTGELPELRDQVYCCPLAIDVIQCFHGSVASAQKVLGDGIVLHKLTSKMSDFLKEYRNIHVKIMKSKQTNTEAFLMANLSFFTQCRDYMNKNASLFPEDVQTYSLAVLNTLTRNTYGHFTSKLHKDLKDLYKKLGTYEWLRDSERVCEELLLEVDRHLQKFTNLEKECHQELLGVMHWEILAEYVRKMMKQKIKLSDKEKQQEAAAALCRNSQTIHTRLSAAGSDMDWLKDILPRLAELLQLQDPDSIKLELGNIKRLHPDLSEHHISAWLKLKGNLSAADLKMILKSITCSQDELQKEQDSLQTDRSFFCTVRIK